MLVLGLQLSEEKASTGNGVTCQDLPHLLTLVFIVLSRGQKQRLLHSQQI